jgi:hypothetical protein
MTHLTLVGIEVIHDRRLVSVTWLALLLSSAGQIIHPLHQKMTSARSAFPQSLSEL